MIREQLDALVTQLLRHHATSGSEPGMDPQLSVRFAIAIAIVVGAAQPGDDFFDAGERLMPELAAFVARGQDVTPPNLGRTRQSEGRAMKSVSSLREPKVVDLRMTLLRRNQ